MNSRKRFENYLELYGHVFLWIFLLLFVQKLGAVKIFLFAVSERTVGLPLAIYRLDIERRAASETSIEFVLLAF